MKKFYEMPMSEVIILATSDVITLSDGGKSLDIANDAGGVDWEN